MSVLRVRKRARASLHAALMLGAVLLLLSYKNPGAELVLPSWSVAAANGAHCPKEMAYVHRSCVDRWEAHMVEHTTGQRLSPYYPPEWRLLNHVYQYWSAEAAHVGTERARKFLLPAVPSYEHVAFEARAVSAPGVLPQGYLTYYTAKKACEMAGKRLCSEEEWVSACRGNKRSQHPYGATYQAGRCNVFRALHPAYELHGNSSLGHLDPRLHLVIEEGREPLLFRTGQAQRCVSETDDGQLFDMVGNLDEWIDDERGVFLGGFYSRATKEGCEAKIETHSPAYTDYSIGVRCCKDAI